MRHEHIHIYIYIYVCETMCMFICLFVSIFICRPDMVDWALKANYLSVMYTCINIYIKNESNVCVFEFECLCSKCLLFGLIALLSDACSVIVLYL